MNFNYKNYNSFLILIPALAAFFITLILTITHQWPLSWDIIYHIQYAKIYSQQGYAFQKTYPPLFHFLLAALGNIFKIDYFLIARILQPILAFSVVLSASYVTKKLYGNLAGISAGFLIVSSYMFFRLMMPLPENLALIFLIFSIYFYYISISQKNLKYSIISGILFLVAFAAHREVPMFLILGVAIFTFIELVIYRNKSVLKNLGAFLLPSFAIAASGLLALIIFKPAFLSGLINHGVSTYLVYFTSSSVSKPITIFKYMAFLGVLVTPFSLIGGIIALKQRQKLGIFLLSWAFIIFFISEANRFGFGVDTVRFLIYMLIPLSILGGFGLSYVYNKLKEYKRFKSSHFASAFLISIFLLSIFLGVLTTEKPSLIYSQSSIGSIQIAPPSATEADLSNWFQLNGDKGKSIIISNRYTGIFLSAKTGMQINPNFGYLNKNSSKLMFDTQNIGYIVIDKRLSLPSENGSPQVKDGGSGLYYLSSDIHSNINQIIPDYARVVYENNDFIVCKI